MPEPTAYETYGKPIIRSVVIFLIAVSLFASYSLISSDGLTPAVIGNIVVSVYVSALVIYGVFGDTVDSQRFRVALYFGVVLWGGERFVSGDESIFMVALLFGGMAMVVRERYFK